MKTPCYGCTERRVGCHSSCEKYAQYRAWVDKKHEEEYKIKAMEDVYYCFVRKDRK